MFKDKEIIALLESINNKLDTLIILNKKLLIKGGKKKDV